MTEQKEHSTDLAQYLANLYEFHLTVERVKDIEHFKRTCYEINVKPIMIDLMNGDNHVMTSSKNTYLCVEDAGRAVSAQTKFLENAGYKVIRQKIEVGPEHVLSQSTLLSKHIAKEFYFESHIGVIVNDESKADLQKMTDKDPSTHLSRNAFKQIDTQGNYVNMWTTRSYNDNVDEFRTKVKTLTDSLASMSLEYEIPIIEYCIYDSDVRLDDNWLTGSR